MKLKSDAVGAQLKIISSYYKLETDLRPRVLVEDIGNDYFHIVSVNLQAGTIESNIKVSFTMQ